MIKKFRDELTSLKTILKEIEELDIIRQLEIKQIDKIKKIAGQIRSKTNWWTGKVR